MAVCDPVSRTTLLENFELIPSDVTDELRTLVLGMDYAVRRLDASTSYNLVGAYDESTGVSSSWPNLVATEVVDLTTADVVAINALANYYADTAAPPTVAQGTQSGTTTNAITHNSAATVWTGSGFTPALNAAVAVGDYVKLDDGSGGTLETRVAGFDYTGGVPNILVLEDDLPTALTSGFFNVVLAEVVPSYTLAAGDVTLTATTVQADSAASITTDRTGSAVDLIAGQTFGGDDLSEIYTNYRALRDTNPLGVLSITSQDDLDANFIGWQYPEAGLGFAVGRALAPADATSTTVPTVLAYAPDADTLTGWTDAANYVSRRQDWMVIAPLTTTEANIAPVETIVDSRNALSLSSYMFIALDLVEEETLVTGAGNTVEVDQSQTPGEDRTVTRDGGVTGPFAAAIVGDIVQIAGVDYVIATKISSQTVTITTAASAGAAQALNNVRHPLTTAEQATDYGTRAQAYNSESVCVVFPPEPTWNSEVVDGFHLAAACAGLRGFAAPQQSLVATQLEDGWGVDQAAYDFFAQLADLGTYGCFVIDQYDHLTKPNAIVLYGNTTDQSSTETGRESVVANKYAVIRFINSDLECLLSRAKVTIELFGTIRSTVSQAIGTLKSSSNLTLLGPVIVDGTIGVISQSAVNADTITVPVTVVINASLENLNVNITINLAVVG